VFIVVRLVRALIFLVLILAVIGVVGFVLGRPFVERLAARSIEDRVGMPVSVSIATRVRTGVLRGDVGNVTVRAKEFEHNGLALADAHAVYHGVGVHLSDLVSREVRLHYSSVDFAATLTPESLVAYLRPLLARRGLPSKKLRVRLGTGTALRRALAGAVQLGPLFDGVRLTGIRLRKGGATITGAGPGGTIKA
jgi:hypothetical protein